MNRSAWGHALRKWRVATAGIALSALVSGCALINEALRPSVGDGSGGEAMVLDLHGGYRTVFCDEHRSNGGTHIGYPTYSGYGSPERARADLCPVAPLPENSNWTLTETAGADSKTPVELWASVVAAEPTQPTSAWPILPELALSCSFGGEAAGRIGISLRWFVPAHSLSGTWMGTYKRSWVEPMSTATLWQASALEAEALWVAPNERAQFVLDLLSAPPTPGAEMLTLRTEVTDANGDTFTAEFIINGWEHALRPLQEDCQDAPP